MLMHLLTDHPMSANTETDWVMTEGTVKRINDQRNIAVQLVWKDVAGDYQAEIVVIASLVQEAESIIERVNVNSNNNVSDSKLIIINPAYRMIKIKYLTNGTPSGKLNAYLYIR